MAIEIQDETELLPPVRVLNAEESWEHFDNMARQLLGIGGEEFLRRWNVGEYDAIADDPEHSDVMYLALLYGVGE